MDAEKNARIRAEKQQHIMTMLFKLNEDELTVFESLLERVSGVGLDTYGHLDLDGDKRDFEAEAHIEDLDSTWYRAASHVRRHRDGHAEPGAYIDGWKRWLKHHRLIESCTLAEAFEAIDSHQRQTKNYVRPYWFEDFKKVHKIPNDTTIEDVLRMLVDKIGASGLCPVCGESHGCTNPGYR